MRGTLAKLGLAGPPELLVYNKRDRLADPGLFLPLARGSGKREPLVISALEGEETEKVVARVDELLDEILAHEEALAAPDESE